MSFELLLGFCLIALCNCCTVNQVHVTLGDMFQLKSQSTHALTVAMVASDCPAWPELILVCEGKRRTVTNIEAKLIDQNLNANNSDATYTRRSIFGFIDKKELECTWQIEYDEKILKGPISFPKKPFDSSSLRIAMVADMDLNEPSKDTVYRLKLFGQNDFDIFLHNGDFAYEIEDDDGLKGDAFFEEMSHVSSLIPYIITPGNHENCALGYLFNYRFRMPNVGLDASSKRQNHYFDFFIKDIYFMTVNFDYVLYLRPEEFATVIAWIQHRLEMVKKSPEIRWTVFFSHRPIICNDLTYTGDCSYNLYALKAFDDLFMRYNITVVLNSHLHIYSRLHPFHNFKMSDFDDSGNGGYLQIISGHAGTSHFFPDPSKASEYQYPFVDKIDLTGPSYLVFDISDDYFDGQLHLSKDDSVLDKFSFRTKNPKHFPRWVFPIAFAVGAFFFLFVTILMVVHLKRMKKRDQELDKDLKTSLLLKNCKPKSVDFIYSAAKFFEQSCRHGKYVQRDACQLP